ncbi:hypothetical protein AWM70_13180 [Paenibacillus yonginensis]|uniref:Uncharacterized protein n=1 Tax=Paenibacillus yonginensis TaxID=1462996 RepID=A0A1B1N206_9BACL|nr:hypothetical protein [Paenibacillus yonginensis]ANS75443.1 hypothetical protein AWM70_13180 [Paenibacillus yonginensis]
MNKIKYMLLKGMLLWGGLSAFLFVLIRLLEGKIHLTSTDLLIELTSTVPVYLFIGICMGEVMWIMKQKRAATSQKKE